jgi:hypothetical protein
MYVDFNVNDTSFAGGWRALRASRASFPLLIV